MRRLIRHLEQLLTSRGHFNIDDELAIGNLEDLRKSITGTLSNVPSSENSPKPQYLLKESMWMKYLEGQPHYIRELDESLFNRLRREVELYFSYKEFWSEHKERAKILRGRKRTDYQLEVFKSEIFPHLERCSSSLRINEDINICFIDNGRVVFPQKFIEVIETFEGLNSSSDVLFFRGHDNASYRLIPSVYRGSAAFFERELLYDTINLLPEEVQGASSNFEVLTKLQHFGTPTRLLDITTNPLVGLYFACSSNYHNGEVLCFGVDKRDIKLFDSDTVSLLSNLSKMTPNFCIDNSGDTKKELEALRELVNKIRSEKSYFENIVNKTDLRRSLFVTSKLNNPRIIRQSGAFIICGMDDVKLSPSPEIYEIERNVSKRIIIARTLKKEIQKSLDIFNISSGSLFPDLSEVSRYIKGKYHL